MTPAILISATAATLFVIAFVIAHRGDNRSWSLSFTVGLVIGGLGAVVASVGSLFLPLTTTQLNEIARTESKCVVQYLSAQSGALRQITLQNAQGYCSDLEDRQQQEAALTGTAQ